MDETHLFFSYHMFIYFLVMVKPYRVVIPDSASPAVPSTGWIMWNVLAPRAALRTVIIMTGGAITVAPQRLPKSYAEVFLILKNIEKIHPRIKILKRSNHF